MESCCVLGIAAWHLFQLLVMPLLLTARLALLALPAARFGKPWRGRSPGPIDAFLELELTWVTPYTKV